MRFHKSETALFVFITLVVAAGMVLAHAYSVLGKIVPEVAIPALADSLGQLSRLIFGAGVLMGTAILFGLLLIYPLIRTQAREEGKLRAMTASLSARSETLEHAALTDPLTGMQNRRYFDDALREYLEEFGKIDRPVGLLILDLDHFKQVNDTHGHDVGDLVLREVSNCLQEFTRYHDVVARLGGEEFAIVAPNMDTDMLAKLAERIRKAIASLTVTNGNVRLRVTASAGLAVWDGREDADDLFRRADRMLYQAKRQGRNRVCA